LAEEALRTSEERMRLGQWAAHVGTFDLDIRTGVDIWTPETEALYGLPPGGFGGTLAAFENLIHPDDRQRVIGLARETMRTGQPTEGEWRTIWPDGSVHWIAGRGQVLRDDFGEPSRMVGVNIDISERKGAEEALHDLNRALEGQTVLLRTREELLRNFVKNVPAGVAMLDRDMRYLQVSDRFCSDYSVDSAQVLGRSHYELFPDIPERWKEIHRRALQGETVRADEDRWDREDGTLWVRWEIRPWRNSDGLQGGILIFAEDITRIKQSEETLSKVNQKLIQAHEAERTRIALELHDDICQRIALLAVRLDDFCHRSPESLSLLRRELAQASEEAQDLGADVQALSHRLHSSKLKYLGLAAAAAGFCREFSDQCGVNINFQAGDIPNELSEDISICLFRVLQEAVQNAAKHSGARHFQVSLRNASNEIELVVHDSGIGFEPEMAFRKNGLGLTSMRERMKLVNGELSIESGLQRGTTVCARIAHEPRTKSVKAG
jgi:PAS domain S-box-containing protein